LPSAIILDLQLPDMDGWVVLDQLKHDNATRHIPVEVISIEDQLHRGIKMGALGWLTKPTTSEALTSALDDLSRSAASRTKHLLLVEDNEGQRLSIMALIGDDGVQTTAVATGHEALAALDEHAYSCMVLDLGLPDMSGFKLLQEIKARREHRNLPIIIYTGTDLSRKQATELERLAETIILKDVRSPERLLAETAIYLHRPDASLPEAQRTLLRDLHRTVPTLAGTTVLVVDDDLRNIFAITSALESHQATVLYAENGKDGLDLLDRNPAIQVVLMDIMMPAMDGYEVMERIRASGKHRHLPIIALTAKAMRDDREKCIQAGASDYIAKPVDMDKLLPMLRVWLSK
jgi:CheY-like chemotaxis protein